MHGARILLYKNVIITIFLINHEGKIKVVVVVVVAGVAALSMIHLVM